VSCIRKRKKINVDEFLFDAAIGGIVAVGCYLSPSFRKALFGWLEVQVDNKSVKPK
jgi:hypothetical protein